MELAECEPQTSRPRKKRKQLSCDPCRLSKLKCDRVEPVCTKCQRRRMTSEQCTRSLVANSSAEASSRPISSFHSYNAGACSDTERETRAQQTHGTPSAHTTDSGIGIISPARTPFQAHPTHAPGTDKYCGADARRLLPRHMAQMNSVLEAYTYQVAAPKPSYDTERMKGRVQQLYTERPFDDTPRTLALLSFLCIVASTVYDLLPPTRLIIWGIVHEADEIDDLSHKLFYLSMDCLHCARQSLEEQDPQAISGDDCLLLIQASLTLTTSPGFRIPLLAWGTILDAAVRLARQMGLDRLGPCSKEVISRERLEKVAVWSGLVYADWTGARYHGSYCIFPSTFDTEWDLTLDQITQEYSEYADGALGWKECAQRMCIWPWTLRVAAVSRQLCEMGVQDASKRQGLTYDKVLWQDGIIQEALDSRPPELTVEMKKENRSPEMKKRLKQYPWLQVQAACISHCLRSSLLSLHMPFLLQGYSSNTDSATSPMRFSVERSLQQSALLVAVSQRMAVKGSLLHLSLLAQHTLFKAGLVIILDLLLKQASRSTSDIFEGSFDNGLDRQLTFAIDTLDEIDRQRRRRCGGNTLSSFEDGSRAPYGLIFSGSRLEKLYLQALRKERSNNGADAAESGRMVVHDYMEAYATNLLRRNGSMTAGSTHMSSPHPADEPSPAVERTNSMEAMRSLEEADFGSMTNEELLNSVMILADSSSGLSIESIFSSPLFSTNV